MVRCKQERSCLSGGIAGRRPVLRRQRGRPPFVRCVFCSFLRNRYRGETKMAARRRKDGGFTQMEVLITAALILILVALALPTLSEARKRSAGKTCVLNRASVRSEADAALICGRWRADAETPENLKEEPKSCRCPAGETYALEKYGGGTFEVRYGIQGAISDAAPPPGG